MQSNVALAREFLKDTDVSREQARYLVTEAMRAGVEGHRGEIFAARVAMASAALNGRDRVSAGDLRNAVELVILPRATLLEEEELPPLPPPPLPPPLPEDKDESDNEDEDADEEPKEVADAIPQEFMFDPEGVLLDKELLAFAQLAQHKKGKAGRANTKIFR
ncbi:hypothetical protein CYMTET_21568 [Cymbomonas tetramitiformis]|uniref:magnesium chelatase n=1 Tax=Cymbomonas tetramitiformis TaxID=36881 RepID=A0AAE0L2S0_9CHLO|nr:hypothetical protein CYMTET_21568 [Cymbomonas tetramitiformis]